MSTHAGIDPAHVARHYDALDPFYRELWGEHLHHGLWVSGGESPEAAVRNLVLRVAQRAHITRGSRVCDVGCGYGATARMLAGEFGARVTGITLSPVQHAHASAHAGDEVRFLLGDWLENDLEDDAFHAVIAIESTEHMDDKPRVFSEARRVLRPDGRLVVCAWLAAESTTPWLRRQLLDPICEEGRLSSLDTASDYLGWITRAGFVVLSCEDVTPNVRRTWSVCTRRLARRFLTRLSSWKYVLDRRNHDRIFALTVPRILLAYRLGAMRYAIFTATTTN